MLMPGVRAVCRGKAPGLVPLCMAFFYLFYAVRRPHPPPSSCAALALLGRSRHRPSPRGQVVGVRTLAADWAEANHISFDLVRRALCLCTPPACAPRLRSRAAIHSQAANRRGIRWRRLWTAALCAVTS